ncbi:MAG TPA: SprT family zinc-dependent metalloprotease [Verrucomicrobiae bacterium]|nr:SprT family zinc-dependent metalloprotease [Verrucomicrobiae bacterium]
MTWFNFMPKQAESDPDTNFLEVHGRQIPLAVIRNHRARRYLLRLRPDGSARLTIPHRGSVTEGRRFAERNTGWLARQFLRLQANPIKPKQWFIGTEILFRGERVKLEAGTNGDAGTVQFGDERVAVPDVNGDLHSRVMKHLWKLAAAELPPKVFELAMAHQSKVQRVTVRNQRSRWGSCSRRGTISLNWKLIQAPPFVRDYIILHELMHLRQMNHSARFWREVEGVCPGFKTAELWLKQNTGLLK